MRRILFLSALLAGILTITSGSALGGAARVAASPSNTALPTIAGTARDGHTLTAANGTWGGTTPITYTYQWQRCTAAGSGCEAIDRATNQYYVPSSTDVAKTIRVGVTATNVDGSSQALSAPTAAVAASPGAPISTRQPNPSGTAKDGQTVTVDHGGWSGLRPITYAYQWQSCTGASPVCSDIAHATSQSLVVAAGQVGSTLRATVTASNSAGHASANSNLTSVVVAKTGSPVNTGLPLISGSRSVGQSLQSSTGSWTGLDTNPFAYQWSRCNLDGSSCASIAGATGQSYGIGQVDLGNALRVSVTATNTSGATSAISTASVITARVLATARFNALLRPGQEVRHPQRISSAAAGHFTARLTGKTLRWTLTFSHLSGRPTIAGLNKGLRGTNGVGFKTLCRSCHSPSHGTLTLTASQRSSMLSGRSYVNVRTIRNGLGEIRGQISRIS